MLCFEPHKGPFHGCLCYRSMSKISHWLGTFIRNLCQMYVYIPYMDPMGYEVSAKCTGTEIWNWFVSAHLHVVVVLLMAEIL